MAERHLDDVDAFVLCGGLGTRLRSALADRPKVLAPIGASGEGGGRGGRAFLEILLEFLHEAGLRRFVLCAGHGAEQVAAVLPTLKRFGDIALSVEDEPLGTGGALRHGLALGTTQTLLATNGDSLCALDLPEMLGFHQRRGSRLTLAVVPGEAGADYGSVRLADDGAVTSFTEKSGRGAGYRSAGVYLMERDWFEKRSPAGPFSLEQDFFPGCVGAGAHGYVHQGSFVDIGTPDRYRDAERTLRALRRRPRPQ